jgi:glutathione peroxidase
MKGTKMIYTVMGVAALVGLATLASDSDAASKAPKGVLSYTYKGQGLRILAFPANNFGHQEPGNNGEIKEFCKTKYKTSFDLFSKISVKGDDQAPLYHFLTDKKTNPKFGGDIEWNFAKFLVDRNGHVVNRFPAGHDPLSEDVVAAIKTELKKPAPKK